MAVGTVSYNATTTLGLSLLKISQPSGHKIDELGFFKPGYLNQDLIPGQSHSTLGAGGFTPYKGGHFGYFFKLKLSLIYQKLVLCWPFLDYFSVILCYLCFSVFQKLF